MADYSQKNGFYLDFLKDIYSVSLLCNVKTYIWGGFSADILESRFLREHDDLDGFAGNMLEAKDELILGYERLGYETEFKPSINMLVIKKNGLHAAFNALDIENGVAMWRHIGYQGTVYFPQSWLDEKPLGFYDAKAYVSGARFEFAFRSNASRLNPEWKVRQKDAVALEYYRRKIEDQGYDANEVLGHFWSYNPFWIKLGYDAFREPVLVCPLKQD